MKHYSTVETFILFTLHMKVSTVLLLWTVDRDKVVQDV